MRIKEWDVTIDDDPGDWLFVAVKNDVTWTDWYDPAHVRITNIEHCPAPESMTEDESANFRSELNKVLEEIARRHSEITGCNEVGYDGTMADVSNEESIQKDVWETFNGKNKTYSWEKVWKTYAAYKNIKVED